MLLCLFLLNKLLLLLLLLPLLLSCKHFQSNGYISPHTRSVTKITTSRSLSEFDKYKNNYDDDPEMKELMKRYNERTAVRLKEYDEQKKKKQKIYKEKYDKDIQEIIVKDKIHKQLTKQFSKLEKVTDKDDLFKGKNEKKVATKGKKGRKKTKKTLGQTLSEWNILPNIDMYEWIPFSSKEAKVDCNIKNIKQALTRVGYIGSNKFVTLGSKDGKDAVDMKELFSFIMRSSNALFKKYIKDDVTSDGSSFKDSTFSSMFIYALWEIFEHIIVPVFTTVFFSSGSSEEGAKEEIKHLCAKNCVCATTPGKECVKKGACACASANNCVVACKCAETCAHECAHAHDHHFFSFLDPYLKYFEILYEPFFALYIIASILLIIYYILKYYRKIKMDKKMKYKKILKK
ncbi:PIR protein, putative [Plasmodium sp. gorilla clade G1]|nr:PIR protein, putative [Plasmodium sp. gorilla clade G1]